MKPPSILRLAGPLIVSFWLRSAFAWVDAFFAAELEQLDGVKGLGDASLAAIGLALPLEFISIACWVGASNGLTARLTAAMGAGEGDRIQQLKRAILRVILGLGLVFLLIAASIWIWAEDWIADPLVGRQFKLYGAVLIGGAAVTSFWAILPDSVVKAHHDTRGTMWAGLLSTITNVILNAVFVFAFGWGILGIAASTVIGRLAGLAFAIYRAAGHERPRIAAAKDDRPGVFDRPVRAIMVLAVPGGITYLLMAIESLAVLALIERMSPPDQTRSLLAAWSIFDRTLRFLLMPAIACAVALLPLTARYQGMGDLAAAKREYSTAIRAGLVFAVVAVLPLCVLLGPWLARALSDTPETQALATSTMYWVPIAVAMGTPFFLARSIFDGLQKPRPGLVASILRSFFFVGPLAVAGFFMGPALGLGSLQGVCLGFALGTAAGSLLLDRWARSALSRA